jgi:hypothetical protein
LLSVGTAVGIWGVSNNFIQRLNLARWLGVAFWPNIEKIGGSEISWRGVPNSRQLLLPSNKLPEVQTFEEWRTARTERLRRLTFVWISGYVTEPLVGLVFGIRGFGPCFPFWLVQ